MKITRPLVLIALLSPALLDSIGSAQTVVHGEFGPGSSVPDESSSVCEDLPKDIDFIANLTTGWAVEQPDTGGVRLIFSDVPLSCSDDADTGLTEIAREQCIGGWSYSLLIPESMLAPGLYDLSEYSVEFREQDAQVGGSGGLGCDDSCPVSGSGGGTAPGGRVDARLELYSVSKDCITGRVIGLSTGQIEPPPPDLNGGFHAVRCAD